MKKIHLFILGLIVANVAVACFSCTSGKNAAKTTSDNINVGRVTEQDFQQKFDSLATVVGNRDDSLFQATVYGKGGNPDCYAGGRNARECKTGSGININGKGDLTVGCGVTCGEGYWACCSYECKCLPASDWK